MIRNLKKILPLFSMSMRGYAPRVTNFAEMSKTSRQNFVITKDKSEKSQQRQDQRQEKESQKGFQDRSQQAEFQQKRDEQPGRMSSRDANERTASGEGKSTMGQKQESDQMQNAQRSGSMGQESERGENTQRPGQARDDSSRRDTSGRVEGPENLGMKRSSEEEARMAGDKFGQRSEQQQKSGQMKSQGQRGEKEEGGDQFRNREKETAGMKRETGVEDETGAMPGATSGQKMGFESSQRFYEGTQRVDSLEERYFEQQRRDAAQASRQGMNQEQKGKQESESMGKQESKDDKEFSASEMLIVSSETDWEGLKQGEKPVILDFYKQGCGVCKRLYPKMVEKAKGSNGKWVFAGADIDKDKVKPLAMNLNVGAAPTVMLFHKGKMIDQFTGQDEGHLNKLIQKAEELSR
jgi:thiol-disulfide isomerase/thioredoxin